MRLAIALVGVFFIFGANAMATVNQASLMKDAEELEKQLDLGPPSRQQVREYNSAVLLEEAKREGIEGRELAALMGQAQHESNDFKTLEEGGKGKGKNYSGGGEKYYGRGIFQLTHDYNYKEYGNLPEIRQYLDANYGSDFKLEDNPDTLVLDPQLSAKVAIAYWKKEVRPAVEKNANGDFGDTYVISAAINRPAANTVDPRRQVRKANAAADRFASSPSIAAMKEQEDALLQEDKLKGIEDRANKTKQWSERLGVEPPSEGSVKPMFQRKKYQDQLRINQAPTAPTSTTPAEQTGASLSPEEEEDELRLKRLKQLYV